MARKSTKPAFTRAPAHAPTQDDLAGLLDTITAMAGDGQKMAAVFNAAGNGDFAKLRALIEGGMDVDLRNDGGYTPLGYAVSDGHVRMVTYLLEKGADVHARTAEGLTPICMAAMKDRAKVFRLLLEAGANPRVRTPDGLTVRKLAEFNNSTAVLAVMNDRDYMARFSATAQKKKATTKKPLPRRR